MTCMKRRDFLEVLGMGAAGTLLASNVQATDSPTKETRTKQPVEFAKGPAGNPMDTKLNIKPVFMPLIHSDKWEGPCRAIAREPEAERTGAQASMNLFMNDIKANLNKDIELLEPAYMEYSENFIIGPEQLSRLEPDRDKTDVYLIARAGMYNYVASTIGKFFKKPIIVPTGNVFISADTIASLNGMGLEGYTFTGQGMEGSKNLISMLKTRKIFQQTRILIITDRGLPPIPVQSCMDVNMLKERFGIESHFVSYQEFSEEMDRVLKSKEWGQKADDRAKQLIEKADESHIDRQHVKRSFEFYYAVKNLMEKYNCNAFTVECFEFCASRIAEKYKITPCLVHTLLKDEGYASACEADLNALLAMRLIMSVSKKSSFMGNPIAISEDRLLLWHSVPGIKMAGYDKPDLPYQLRHFVESGWGTKVMIDFTVPEDKTVTLARFNQSGAKIFLVRGEIVDCSGYRQGDFLQSLQKANLPPMIQQIILKNLQMDPPNLIGCILAAHIKVPDAKGCLRNLREFGSHLSMVYGDYTKEMTELADMMGIEVVYEA